MLAQDTSRSLARCPPSDRRQRSRPRFWVPTRPMPHTWYQLWPCAFDLRRVCTCLLQRYMTEGKEFCHACKVLVIFFNCMHGTSPSHSHLLPGLRGSHPTAAPVVCTAVRSPFSVRLCTSDTVIPPTFCSRTCDMQCIRVANVDNHHNRAIIKIQYLSTNKQPFNACQQG
jgi:hypothetical protein